MSLNRHSNKESPWAVLDPSLKQHPFLNFTTNEPKKYTYLDYPLPIKQPVTLNSALKRTSTTEKGKRMDVKEKITKEPKERREKKLPACLNIIKEIDDELYYHRYSIYIEKLAALEKELLLIEKDEHKEISCKDLLFEKERDEKLIKINRMYQYELATIDVHAEKDKEFINEDYKEKTSYATKVVNAERVASDSSRKRNKTNSEEDDLDLEASYHTSFKKIHLKKKVGKLEAIHNRQKATKAGKQHFTDKVFDIINKDEVDNDLKIIKQSIEKKA